MPDERGARGPAPGAPRTFWSGTLTFGLVQVPVRLFSVVRPGRESLRMVDEDGTPLEQRYRCPEDGEMVERHEIVRGYDVSDEGEAPEYVVVTDEELEGLQPEKSHEIDLHRFVPEDDLDPVFFRRGYVLEPAGDSTKAYRLLARVLEERGRAGVASFVLQSREHLVAIVARDGILRAETLRFHDEIRTPGQVGLPDPAGAPEERVRRLVEEIRSREEEGIDRSEMVDRTAEILRAVVASKRDEGEGASAEPGGGTDLTRALRRSLGGDEIRAVSLDERTKEELYELARELDVEGRSGMTREELLKAVRAAR